MKGTGIRDGAPKTLLARALYDNHPDCSDELAFSRGDILTILEQKVPESEGWWKCLLHGRPGLAPANRLQVLPEAPTDRPCPPLLRGREEALASPEETYQVPTMLQPPPPDPVYEPMKSWVEGPPPATAQVYVFPDPPSSARIVCEKTLSLPKQTIFVLPRPARTSLPVLPSQVYDVPTQSRVPSALKELEKQPLYDIPGSPQKATLHLPPSQARAQNVPLTTTITFRREGCDTLLGPQKPEWIYDTPVSLGKASQAGCAAESGPTAAPGSIATVQRSPSSRAKTLPPQPGNSKSMEKKLSLPEVLSCASLVPAEKLPSDTGTSYKVPSSFLVPRVEQQNTKPNIYDIPIAKAGGQLWGAPEALEKPRVNSSWLSTRTTSLSTERDRSSISSTDSRASVVSSCSSMSDSSSSSFSEESAKELSLDLDLAKETAVALQHKVVSAAAALLLFVSRTWRFRDSLEANIDAIRRAAGHTEGSLREFLDFARGVLGTAGNLTDGHLKTRIRDQLQTISSSYQILLEAKESLDGCNWSLEVLVTDEVQNSLDDLERFVMVARMVPEDVKRFVSIVIANGRLLFKQNCEKEETMPLTPEAEIKCEKCIQHPQREIELYQKSTPFNKQRESQHSQELLKKNQADVCGQAFSHLEEKEKPILEQRFDENKDSGTMPPSCLKLQPSRLQNAGRKVHLSEHCRLYFGALFKAIGMFNSSLSHSQPPEVFITHSKLVITVGQKLVDTLCQETQERDVRNEILCSSSHLCGLLKDLALATKSAVLQYPSPAALGHLQAEAEKLEQHTRQFRGTLE